MTDEQKFEEWLDDEYKYLIEDTEGNLINITKKVREAYLAGLHEGKLDKTKELEKEKCELLGLIQEKDKRIEKMKRCYNCKFNDKFVDVPCDDCEDYNKWELAE